MFAIHSASNHKNVLSVDDADCSFVSHYSSMYVVWIWLHFFFFSDYNMRENVRKLFQAYSKLLNRYPGPVQSVQTSALMAVGDVTCQLLVEKKSFKTLDKMRILKFGGIGLFFIVSISFFFFSWMILTICVELPNASRSCCYLADMDLIASWVILSVEVFSVT